MNYILIAVSNSCKLMYNLFIAIISLLQISVIPHHHTENQIPVTAIDSASNNQQEVKSSPSSISPLYNNQSPVREIFFMQLITF